MHNFPKINRVLIHYSEELDTNKSVGNTVDAERMVRRVTIDKYIPSQLSEYKMSKTIKDASKLIEKAKYIVALTGAGISQESNVPTFRGEEGLWRNYSPMELATPTAFDNDPALVWEWYSWRQNLIANCRPNDAHRVLAKWEEKGILESIITQNVDGLHRRAGSERILEVHGNIFRVRCTSCSFSSLLEKPVDDVPHCPNCDSLLRPDVVWFGESLNPSILNEVYAELGKADLLLVVGTSAVVQPAASFPLIVARNDGILIEINPETTPLTNLVNIHLEIPAGTAFKQLDEKI